MAAVSSAGDLHDLGYEQPDGQGEKDPDSPADELLGLDMVVVTQS